MTPTTGLPASSLSESEDNTGNRKRTLDLLAVSLSNTGWRKKYKEDILIPYIRAGRWIPRGISPFLNLTSTFWIGMAEADCDQDADLKDVDNVFISQFSDKEREHLSQVYNDILDLVPGFRDQMKELGSEPHTLDRIIDTMTEAAKGARSDDTGGLKMKAVLYIPLNPRQEACMPPIANEKSKSDRGFNHPMTSRLLCPQKMLPGFDADPLYVMMHILLNPESHPQKINSAMRAKFLDGTIKIVANDWPAFLYDQCMYDPQEIDKGLLRGYFLVRVYRHIFTSPSSALKESPNSNSTRSGNAKLHNMTRVTPATLAYAAVQARFFLSTTKVWSSEDGDFKLDEFHSSIIQLFKPDPSSPGDDEWVTETLAWWDKTVFGVRAVRARVPAVITDITNSTPLSDRVLLLAQRAHRHAQRANLDLSHPRSDGQITVDDCAPAVS